MTAALKIAPAVNAPFRLLDCDPMNPDVLPRYEGWPGACTGHLLADRTQALNALEVILSNPNIPIAVNLGAGQAELDQLRKELEMQALRRRPKAFVFVMSDNSVSVQLFSVVLEKLPPAYFDRWVVVLNSKMSDQPEALFDRWQASEERKTFLESYAGRELHMPVLEVALKDLIDAEFTTPAQYLATTASITLVTQMLLEDWLATVSTMWQSADLPDAPLTVVSGSKGGTGKSFMTMSYIDHVLRQSGALPATR